MKIQLRTVKGSKMKNTGLTPGVIYGKGMESVAVQVKTNDFQKMFSAKGTSKTFDITLDGKKHIVYIKDTQSSYENHNIKTHFDLVKVAADDTMTSKINLVFLNHEQVEKRGLIVNAVMTNVEVEYGVGSGISKLEIDVAGLEDHDTLLVSDIKVPEGVTILEEMDAVVVTVSTPKEEVVVDEDAEVVTEVESIKQSAE
jgi:large subunit ribosomal protein L25